MELLQNTCLFTHKRFAKNAYFQYRIPGIVVTKKDTILTYFEARVKFGDWAPIDILYQRSTDGGKTFTTAQRLVSGSKERKTMNNPVMLVGNDNTIHFLYSVEYTVKSRGGAVFYCKSIDDGLTFTPPKEISSIFAPLGANVIGIGPGHGICTKKGVLMSALWFVPANQSVHETSHAPANVSTVYSLDNGAHWQVGQIIPSTIPNLNESELTELSDGQIMINMRAPKTGCRAVSVSATGYSEWSEARTDTALTDPTCFGGIVSAPNNRLFFVNCAHQSKRKNLTVKRSTDNGVTWETQLLLYKNEAGYADIAADSRGIIYVAYEVKSGKSYYVAAMRE